MAKKLVVLAMVVGMLLVTSVGLAGCGGNADVSFADLIAEPEEYDGKTVTLEAFCFTGFEISALSGMLERNEEGRTVPSGELVWMKGITQEVFDGLFTQSDTPSGYEERFGKVKVTGKFETGSRYGHMDAYGHLMNVTEAQLLDWKPLSGK